MRQGHRPQQRAIRRRYVNAYAVEQHYGGPEEGGWWYDAGRALASIEINTRHPSNRVHVRQEATIERLRQRFADVQTDRPRWSAGGGVDLEIYVEDHPAIDYPASRPFYE